MRYALLLAAIALLGVTTTAQAAITKLDYGIAPSSLQAGGAPDVAITTAFTYDDPDDDVKDVSVRLPPGLLGNPLNAARCGAAQFAADACPAGSDIGGVVVKAFAQLLPPLVETSTTSNGDVYNLEPTGGEPARIGVVVRPTDPVLGAVPLQKVFLQAPAELQAGPDGFALDTTFRDVGNTVGGVPIRIQSFTQTFAGTVGGKPFMRMPTSCATATGSASANSYKAPATAATATTTVTPTGCDTLAFSPKLDGTIGAAGATALNSRPPLTTILRFDPSQAALKTASVTLPSYIGPNIAITKRACPTAAFAAGGCPASARVGSASAVSPLSATPLSGPVLVVADPGQLPKVAVQLSGVVNLTLLGSVAISTKGVTTTFAGSPDLPLETFTLAFDGDGLVQTGRNLCEAGLNTTATGVLGAHSGATANVSGALRVVGCNGTVAPGGGKKKAKKPRAKGRLKVDGDSARLTATIVGNPKLRRVRLALPKGLTGPGAVTAKAGGKKIAAKRVKAGKRILTVRLAKPAKRVTIAWKGLHVGAKLAKRPKVGARVTGGNGKRYGVPFRPKR